MKYLAFLLFIQAFFICCSSENKNNFEPEVVFFLQSDEIELISDYEFYLEQLRSYYSDKNIKITEINERVFKNGSEEIKIKDDASFAMLLIDKKGKHKIQYSFGTDIDLMMEINDFFEIK